MWKKLNLIIFGFAMFGIILFSGGTVRAQAASLNDIVSGLDAPVQILEERGENTYEPVAGTGTDVAVSDYKMASGQNYHLIYKWKIEDNQPVSDGDTATVGIPNNESNNAMTFDVKNADTPSITVGSYSMANDATQGTITFNDEMKNYNVNRSGQLTISVAGTWQDSTSNPGGSTEVTINKNGWPDKDAGQTGNIPNGLYWNISFNDAKQKLGRVVVKDDLGAYQKYVDGSLNALENTSKDASGNTIGTTITPTVNVNGSEIVMIFDHVTSNVELTYRTTTTPNAPGIAGTGIGYFSNYAELLSSKGVSSTTHANGINDDDEFLDQQHKDIVWGGNGSVGGAFTGEVTLTKEDATNSSILLNGAEYKLQRLDGADYVDYQTHLTTDPQGIIYSGGLQAGEYRFIETQAPNGYLLDPAGHNFSIVAGTPASSSMTRTDTPNSVTLTKTDTSNPGKPLAQAYYDLLKENDAGSYDKYQESLKTDDKGQITVSKLDPGKYEFSEAHAPSGYKLNESAVGFSISRTDTAAQSVSQTDESSSTTSSKPDNPDNPGTTPSASNSSTKGSGSDSGSSSYSGSNSGVNGANGGAGGNGTSTPMSSTKHVTTSKEPVTGTQDDKQNGKQAISGLPQTNEQRFMGIALIGFLLLGGVLSYAAWQRNHD